MAEAGSLGGGVVDLAQALDGGAGVGGGHEVYGQVGAFGGGEGPWVPGSRAGRVIDFQVPVGAPGRDTVVTGSCARRGATVSLGRPKERGGENF